MRSLLPFLLAPVLLAGAAPAEEPVFPAGTSSQTLEGLRCSIVMPEGFDPAKEHSLLVILHGAGGTETGMAGSLADLAARDFVVLAPKSSAQTWSKPDTDAVCRIVTSLKKRLHIGANRLHAAGFSNGGWNLKDVAFDEDLHCTTACWIAAGFDGGTIPKYAKKEMAAMALAGSEDPNRKAAEATVDRLQDKVRTVECHIQQGLAHAWPEKLVPYYEWWLGAMEGRFVPGECPLNVGKTRAAGRQ